MKSRTDSQGLRRPDRSDMQKSVVRNVFVGERSSCAGTMESTLHGFNRQLNLRHSSNGLLHNGRTNLCVRLFIGVASVCLPQAKILLNVFNLRNSQAHRYPYKGS